MVLMFLRGLDLFLVFMLSHLTCAPALLHCVFFDWRKIM